MNPKLRSCGRTGHEQGAARWPAGKPSAHNKAMHKRSYMLACLPAGRAAAAGRARRGKSVDGVLACRRTTGANFGAVQADEVAGAVSTPSPPEEFFACGRSP